MTPQHPKQGHFSSRCPRNGDGVKVILVIKLMEMSDKVQWPTEDKYHWIPPSTRIITYLPSQNIKGVDALLLNK